MISYNDLKNIAKELEATTGLQPLELLRDFLEELDVKNKSEKGF